MSRFIYKTFIFKPKNDCGKQDLATLFSVCYSFFSSSNVDPNNQFGEFETICNKSFLVLEPKKDEKILL